MTAASIETERLILRDWTDADLAPFAALNADPRVMEFFPAALDRVQSDTLAARIRTNLALYRISKKQWLALNPPAAG